MTQKKFKKIIADRRMRKRDQNRKQKKMSQKERENTEIQN